MWPLSREAYPKQFHRLVGVHSLFQETCRRLSGDIFEQITILSSRQHRFLVTDQLHEIRAEAARIVLEPISRNTAPAACVAALIAYRTDPEALVLLAPSDHVIADDASFAASVQRGIDTARKGALITFGVRPDCPHTGYGYIESSGKPDQSGVFAVRRLWKTFKETAASYLKRPILNAGILFDTKVMLRLFETLALKFFRPVNKRWMRPSRIEFLPLGPQSASHFSITPSLEGGQYRWFPQYSLSDVGSWSELWNSIRTRAVT
jgi:mannose-1-phosphate guanylyltransferase